MNIKEGRINISIAEAIAAVATIVSVSFTVILWSENRYQSKEEAKKIELAANDRLNKLEDNMRSVQEGVGKIAVDVSYIRGKMENK